MYTRRRTSLDLRKIFGSVGFVGWEIRSEQLSCAAHAYHIGRNDDSYFRSRLNADSPGVSAETIEVFAERHVIPDPVAVLNRKIKRNFPNK